MHDVQHTDILLATSVLRMPLENFPKFIFWCICHEGVLKLKVCNYVNFTSSLL